MLYGYILDIESYIKFINVGYIFSRITFWEETRRRADSVRRAYLSQRESVQNFLLVPFSDRVRPSTAREGITSASAIYFVMLAFVKALKNKWQSVIRHRTRGRLSDTRANRRSRTHAAACICVHVWVHRHSHSWREQQSGQVTVHHVLDCKVRPAAGGTGSSLKPAFISFAEVYGTLDVSA